MNIQAEIYKKTRITQKEIEIENRIGKLSNE